MSVSVASDSSNSWPYSPNSEVNIKSQAAWKHGKSKVTPELDMFAQKRKRKDEGIEKQLSDTSSAIATAMSTVTSVLQTKNRDPYIHVIEDSLSRIDRSRRTECIIEVLQILKKYEDTNY